MAPAPTAPPSPPSPRFPLRSAFAAGAVLLAAGLLAYQNGLRTPFVFDDELAIVGNPSIRHLLTSLHPPPQLQGLPISGRPVVNFSFGLSYALSGGEVRGYHAFNIAIHLLAGFTLFGILRRTLTGPLVSPRLARDAFGLALACALAWTLHPLQTESVTYISQRAEALVGLAYLGTLWLFIRAVAPGASRAWAILAVLACALGMLTKEVMVSAPLLVALYDRAFVAGSWRDVWRRHGRLHLALASTWIVMAAVVFLEGGARGVSAGFGLGVSPWTYLLTQAEAIALYLKLSFWPHPLVLDYGTWLATSVAEVWWQGLLVLALLGASAWAVVRRPQWGCLGAWFFLILAPSSSVIPLVGQTIAEHRMYLPLAAVIVTFAVALHAWLGRTALVVLFAGAAVLAVGTEFRNRDYATAIAICESTVAHRPQNGRAMALLADYYRRAGRTADARVLLERSLQVEPGVLPVENNLGTVWQELNEPAKAVEVLQDAARQHPRDALTLVNLGDALVRAGRVDDGIEALAAAVRLAPGAWEPRFNLANVLAQRGRLEDAAATFAELVQAHGERAEIHASYSDVLQALGKRGEALAQLEAAVRAQPGDASLHDRYGAALGRAGRLTEALDQFEEALRLDPADTTAQKNAEIARRRLGRQ